MIYYTFNLSEQPNKTGGGDIILPIKFRHKGRWHIGIVLYRKPKNDEISIDYVLNGHHGIATLLPESLDIIEKDLGKNAIREVSSGEQVIELLKKYDTDLRNILGPINEGTIKSIDFDFTEKDILCGFIQKFGINDPDKEKNTVVFLQ